MANTFLRLSSTKGPTSTTIGLVEAEGSRFYRNGEWLDAGQKFRAVDCQRLRQAC